MPLRWQYALITLLALIWAILVALMLSQPGYTDAYYYYNAARRLVEGQGLTDPYLWTYFNAPDHLPGPSHTYWMPLESLVAALSMIVFGTTFRAAQLPSVLCYTGLVLLAFGVGRGLGGAVRHGWLAGLLLLFSGFYVPFWVTTDTFALYGLIGALALLSVARATERSQTRWYALAGALCGLAHLTRADGVLLLLVALGAALTSGRSDGWGAMARSTIAAVLAYLLVMAPWFVRNISVLGTPLPLGGTDTIWMRSYDDLVRYPPGSSPADFLAWGIGPILRSRWTALLNNFGTLIAVETWVVLGPLALSGAWQLRGRAVVRCVAAYALLLHLVMTFVFAFPGYRGGLFHSAAALMPFWAAVTPVGLETTVAWAARRRRWRYTEARRVFSTAAVVLAFTLSVGLLHSRLGNWNTNAEGYRELLGMLPADAVVMINDPPALYYHTGLAGVVVPNTSPDVVPEIAARYGVTHLLLDVDRTRPFTGLFLGQETRPYLRLLHHEGTQTPGLEDDWLLFAIQQGDNAP